MIFNNIRVLKLYGLPGTKTALRGIVPVTMRGTFFIAPPPQHKISSSQFKSGTVSTEFLKNHIQNVRGGSFHYYKL